MLSSTGGGAAMQSKPSLRVLDNAPELQEQVTNQAFLFAQMTLAAAKKNSLTRAQIIKEGSVKRKR